MKAPSLIISIPEPCHEDWEDMSPCAQGRFCAACQKTVVDFSELSDAAVARILSTQQVCGRFALSQLNRPLEIPMQAKRGWLQRAAAILLLPLAPLAAKAQQKTEQSPVPATKQTRISGVIRDNLTGKPLYGMEIHASGLGIKYSNAQGVFHFIIPENFAEQEILIEAKYTETSSKSAPASSILPISITLPARGTETEVILQRYASDTLNDLEIITWALPPVRKVSLMGTSFGVEVTPVRIVKHNIFQRSWSVLSKPFKKVAK